VARPSLQTEAFILQRDSPQEAFRPSTAFSAEHGLLRVLQRIPRKPSPDYLPLDLFDRVGLMLEGGNAGSWFVKEVRLLERFTGIGAHYRRLQPAAEFTALIARNSVHEDSRDSVYRLLQTALTAFSITDRPDIVGFKSRFCFARDEGYPLREHWFSTLRSEDRTTVADLLNRPTSDQTISTTEVARLGQKLEDYLRGHTDILVD